MGIVMLVILLAFSWPLWVRISVCLLPLLLAGTYRVSTIKDDKFRSQLYVAFVPFKTDRCNLPGVMYIETKYNAVGHVPDTLPGVGLLQRLLGTLIELLAPTLGGAYEIWIITAKGREIPAWQGFSQQNFDENVALLKTRCNAEVRGRSQ